MVTAGAVLALPVAVLSGPPGTPNLEGVVSLIGVGVLSTALAWPVFFRVLRRTTATAASTVTFIVPAFALAFAAVILGEAVGPELLVGFGLTLVSLCLVLGIAPRLRLPIVARVARAAGAFGRS
jgi:drug/metabolite transporter (DMT)-like permease